MWTQTHRGKTLWGRRAEMASISQGERPQASGPWNCDKLLLSKPHCLWCEDCQTGPQLATWQGSPRSVSHSVRQIPHMQEPSVLYAGTPFLMAWVMYFSPAQLSPCGEHPLTSTGSRSSLLQTRGVLLLYFEKDSYSPAVQTPDNTSYFLLRAEFWHPQPQFFGWGGKESACNAGDPGLILGLGRSPGEGNGNLLQ